MRKLTTLTAIGALALPALLMVALDAKPAAAADPLLLNTSGPFLWTDLASGGQITVTVNTYENCTDGTPFEMTFEYLVENLNYDPIPATTNGLSGFQINFNQAVPELHNQLSPAIGGPWVQNAFSGQAPPFGVEWDVPFGPPNLGIMPGQMDDFSFCTDEREEELVNSPPDQPLGFGPNGWAHTWLGGQAFIFNGPNVIPGDLLAVLGLACSAGDVICKKVKYSDDGDGIIEVGEPVSFRVVIIVDNDSGQDWTNVVVKDRFGAEIDVTGDNASQGAVTLTTKGKSEKEFLTWDIGDLDDGESATLVLDAETDITPGGDQSYTECSLHEFNSGAVVKFRNEAGKQRSFETGGIVVSVLTENAQGDCDLDGFSDADELAEGTDPHDPEDFPVD